MKPSDALSAGQNHLHLSAASAALARYQQAKSEQAAASAQQSSWQPPAPEVDPTTGVPLPAVGPPPTNPHDASVTAAASALQSALDDIEDVRTRQRSAEETCVGELDEAGSIGERNDSGWKKFLAKASSVLKIVGLVLLVIAVIAVVVMVGPMGMAFGAALGTAFGGTAGAVMAGVGGAAIAVDATRRARGDEGAPSWKSLAFDTVLTVGPGAMAKGAKFLGGADDVVRVTSSGDDIARSGRAGRQARKKLTEVGKGSGIRANNARGRLGEQRTLEKLARRRDTVKIQRQVTLKPDTGRATRIDYHVTTKSGNDYLVEVKTGAGGFTKNQQNAIPQIEKSGFTPRGKNAADAGLKVGVRRGPMRVEVHRVPWPIPNSPFAVSTVPVMVDNGKDLVTDGVEG